MTDILDAIKDKLQAQGDQLSIIASNYQDVNEVYHFFEQVLSVEQIIIQKKGDVPLITSAVNVVSVAGQTNILGLEEIDITLKFEDHAGQLDISIDGSLASDLTPPLIKWLSLSQPGLTLAMKGKYRTITLAFHGDIKIGSNVKIPVVLKKISGDSWQLEIAGEGDQSIHLPSDFSASVASLMGKETTGVESLNSFLPKALVDVVKGIAVTGISATFDPVAKSVSYFSLGFEYSHQDASSGKWDKSGEWEITSKLKVRDLRFTLMLINPILPDATEQGDTEGLEDMFNGFDLHMDLPDIEQYIIGTIFGTVVINETPIQIFVRGSGGHSTLWTIAVLPPSDNSGIILPSLSDILEFAGGRGFMDSLPDGFKDIPHIVIHRLEMDFNPSKKTLDLISFHISTDHSWKIIEKYIELQNLEIELNLQNLTDVTQRSIEGSIHSTFQIPSLGIVFYLSARLNTGLVSTWQFEGSADLEEEPPQFGTLIKELAEHFGLNSSNIHLPTPVETFKISALGVSFNSHSKDFTFTCEGNLTLGDEPINATITVETIHQSNNTFDKRFTGHINIGSDFQFHLIFDANNTNKTFIAAYNDPRGHPQGIRELVNYVSSELAEQVPASLQFTLKHALFAYQSQAQTTSEASTPKSTPESKYLFGLDIEGGLNLSDLKLPDLPLISSQPLPPDQMLKLAFQILVTNETFIVEEVAALNALNKDGLSLPAKEIKGVGLAASLRLGQETMQLSLPVGLNQQPKEGESGLTHVSQLPAEAAKADPPHTAAQAASPDGTQWLKIQKSFGPVHFERVGLKYQNGQISGLLDAALTVGGLTIGLDGLTVTSPLGHFEPTFDLRGLSIDYRNGPVEIGGAFLRVETGFAGLAVIRTEKLTLSAIGAYADMAGQPSLFIYAVLDYPLGGPAFFYVTGLAAGLGYNRALTMPTIDQIASFPLVETVLQDQAPPSLPTDAPGRQATITTELNKLSGYLPATLGEHFLAVGVRFTSFKMIDSFALLVVKFGHRFEIDLLGLSTLVAPAPVPGKPPVPPVAEVQLALKATFIPDEGFLGVLAQLTPHSYLLSKACHLTGGFAFYVWFAPHPNAGDFVVTLGGYHPQYQVPAHYPQVPRLGFNWQVDPHLNLKGDAYFAMTPQALMAGGHLEATWQMDHLKAWFKAGIDFLITWQPYHYDAAFYVDIGVTYTFDFFGSHTITVELGADLHIWGPEFSGTAHIHWYIISFEVSFGPGTPQLLEPIDWPTFKQSFLPLKKETDKDDPICTISVQEGLVRQVKEGEDEYWIINPKELVLATNAVIPSNQAFKAEITRGEIQAFLDEQGIKYDRTSDLLEQVRQAKIEKIKALLDQHAIVYDKHETSPELLVEKLRKPIVIKQETSGQSVPITAPGIGPMAVRSSELTTRHTITIRRDGHPVSDDFDYVPILKGMPVSLWGEPKLENGRLKPLDLSDLNGKQPLIENSLAGFEIRAKAPTPGVRADIDRSKVQYETEPVPETYRWEEFGDMNFKQGQEVWNQATAETILSAKSQRDKLLKALGLADAIIDFGQPVNEDVLVI